MRFAFAALTLLCALSLVPNAPALVVCPTSEFRVVFEPDSAQLDEGDVGILGAGAARARICGDLGVVELVVAGDLQAEDSLASRRSSAVREVLVRNGLNPDALHAVNVSRESYGSRVQPTADTVTILIFFDPPSQR